MPLLLPLGALVAYWLALVSRGEEARRALLRTALAGGGFVLLTTEALSRFEALARTPLAVAWALAALAALARIRWAGLRDGLASIRFPLRSPTAWVALAAAAFALGGSFLSAVYGPPNMVDVMNYHMPRVVYWQINRTVDFYPTSYYQQLSLQPFMEYSMLQLYALAESNRFVQLAQWAVWLTAIVASSLVAKRLGAGGRGQALAAGLCATLPAGAVQASGAKPDIMAAAWLLLFVYFALSLDEDRPQRGDIPAAGLAAGLALLSKGTAYIFGAGLGVGLLLGLSPRGRLRFLRAAPAILAVALLANLPFYARNYRYNGQPLGDGSASGGGADDRFANDRLGLDVTLSNILRNLPQQLTFRPAWNEAIYEAVVAAHERLGMDPNDPATSWSGLHYRPASVSTHEGEVSNVRHLLLLFLSVPWLVWRRKLDAAAGLAAGVLCGAVLFCALLKWQPWHARMHLPLFVAAVPVLALFLEAWRPRWPATLALVWLAWNLRAPVLHNSLRPLAGPRPVFETERFNDYFHDWPGMREPYRLAADLIIRSGCKQVGFDATNFQMEYPIAARLRRHDFSTQFRQMGVANASRRYTARIPFREPCAVVCLECGELPEKRERYARFGAPRRIDNLLVFVKDAGG
ncbi:MAG: hypothetical protein GC160_10040 [Acidobacteria bacterium]|nr:hypothetical protein [Acidobacteriota bacterium]